MIKRKGLKKVGGFMRKSKILVVEDEAEIGLLIKKYLEVEGYQVLYKEDGEQGLEAFKEDVFDLVMTDIMMPVMDGVELCQNIRKISHVPIIFLTAKDEELDKLQGLMHGADDYITKPFSIREVVARVKSLLRRYLELSQPVLTTTELIYGLLKIDLTNELVYKDQVLLPLRIKEYELLSLLAKKPGKIFTKSEIFEKVWHDKYMGDDNTLSVHMRRLRKKIEDDPTNPKYIQTVWGLGYKFISEDEL
jgi:DNA-binding response OmpR family regulator